MLLSAGGTPLGGFVALRSRALELAGFRDLGVRIALGGVGGLLLAFAFSWVVAQRISRPVRGLVAASRRAAEGDYSAPDRAGRTRPRSGPSPRRSGCCWWSCARNSRWSRCSGDARSGGGISLAARGGAGERTDGSGRGEGRLNPGQLFAGRFEVLAPLGEGGMGVVYRARRPGPGRCGRAQARAVGDDAE